MAKSKHETNSQRLTRLMEHSHCGPLMQAFIMMAIMEYAKKVVEHYEAKPEELEKEQFVNPKAWLACAKEVVMTWYDTWEEVESRYAAMRNKEKDND